MAVALTALGIGTCLYACGTPPATQAPAARPTPAAQQTFTALWRVVSDGDPPATATAVATPNAAPSCPNAIWWFDAAAHAGETRTVQGPVVDVRAASQGNALLVSLGQRYPDPTGLTVVVPWHAPSTTAATPSVPFSKRTVCVTGAIQQERGLPVLRVQGQADLVVQGAAG